MINKTESKVSIIIKTLISLFLLYIYLVLADENSMFSKSFDSSFYTKLHRLLLLSFICFFIIIIWTFNNKKTRKIFFPLTIISLLITIGFNIYYDNYSMKIEPLLHLYKKYNIKISDMQIIKAEEYYSGDWFGMGGHNRNAFVRYRGNNIYVYYRNNTWNDDYEKQVNFDKNDKLIKDKLNNIMKEYTTEYKIITDPETKPREDLNRYYYNPNLFSYIIYLYSNDENEIDEIIQKLNYYSNNTPNLYYSLYIVKDKNIFNKLKSINISNYKNHNSNLPHTFINDILRIINYSDVKITESPYFDKNIFINNGNETNTKNTNYQEYEYLIFEYNNIDGLKLYVIFPNNN